MTNDARCPACDRRPATDAEWRDVPGGERPDLCWGTSECEGMAVDWRERALKAEREHEDANAALSLMYDDRERLRAQLAALRAAVSKPTILRKLHGWALAIRPDALMDDVEKLDAVLADTAAAAGAYNRHERAAALREAANGVEICRRAVSPAGLTSTIEGDWLRAEADRIERGE